ncbi:hypothetical protein BC828DRAFT_402319 [Blastocladiella britannica]|nr:hypothetical protein BC828DRAFT_402319 [Blastocladiella britannica]
MGNTQSVFTEEDFEWFEANTFFNRSEILRFYSYFNRVTGGTRVMSKIQFTELPELHINPFRNRIAEVFSNDQGVVEFVDFLDFLSAFSEDATKDVKSFYAFRIYDYDEDDYLGMSDVRSVVAAQVGSNLSEEEIDTVVAKIFVETDIDGDNRLSFVEFDHVMARCPDFVKYDSY